MIRGAWLLILVLPIGAAVFLLNPSFSEFEVGVLAEWISNRDHGTPEFVAWATAVRGTLTSVVIISLVVGWILWGVTVFRWLQRVGEANAATLPSYRGWAVRKSFWTFLLAAALAVGVGLTDVQMRDIAVGGWVILAVVCGALAFLQYWVCLFGVWNTRANFTGRG